jgi:opacity protein-like surface antigen
MVKRFFSSGILLVVFIIFMVPDSGRGETAPTQGNPQESTALPEPPKVEPRKNLGVALGLRYTFSQMTQNTGNIIGNVNLLEEEQNYSPLNPMIQVSLSKYLALELGYYQFKAKTLNRAFDVYPEHDPRFSDGAVEWSPLMLALQFRWPHFHKSVVPYVLGGLSYTKTSWDRKDWYYYGFPYPWVYDEWIGQGKSPQDFPNAGYRRIFAVDDHTIGTLLGVGVDYFIWKNLALNLDFRYHWATVNFSYTLAYDEGRDVVREVKGTFGLDSWILGLGLKYFF